MLCVSKFILNQSANKLIRCMILLTFHNCIILYLFKDESFDHFPKQSQRVSRKKVFQLRAHFQFMLTQKVFALFHRTFHILFKFCELFVLSKMQHTSNSFLLVPHSDFITSIVELFFPSALVYILIRNMCEIAKMLFTLLFLAARISTSCVTPNPALHITACLFCIFNSLKWDWRETARDERKFLS